MNYLSQSKQLYNGFNSCSLISFIRFISTARLKDCHKILEVDKSSTPKQIKESFLRLSKIYHPDNKSTGSHTKFVKLKQAYDEIKDAPSSQTSDSTFSRAQEDLRHSTYARYRDQERSYYDNAEDFARRYHEYAKRQPGYDAEHPEEIWRRVKRNKTAQARKQQQNEARGKPFLTPLTSFTIFLGAVAWIFIYSGVLLVWDYSDHMKKSVSGNRSRSYQEYLAYREYVKKKQEGTKQKYDFPEATRVVPVAPADK